MPEANFKWYVYELVEKIKDGFATAYIGKGSRHRLRDQIKRYGLEGREVCRFMDESDAYMYERHLIFEHWPRLNQQPGYDYSLKARIRKFFLERGYDIADPAQAALLKRRFGPRPDPDHPTDITLAG